MRILILTPWKNAWIQHYSKVFEERGHQVKVDHDGKQWQKADVYLHMWTGMSEPKAGAINIMFLRRFEFFEKSWRTFPWERVDRLVFCNSFFQSEFNAVLPDVKTELVYNAVDTSQWAVATGSGKKIGMACHIHPKKNLPLAVQVLQALGEGWELHIAGQVQDQCTALYLASRGLNIKLYGHVADMDKWWQDKDFCLSTSISEGNPNNVIEAMAKNIKPVVHNWPGSRKQFPGGCIFSTVSEAVEIITGANDGGYREFAETRYSLNNFRRVVDIVEDIARTRQED